MKTQIIRVDPYDDVSSIRDKLTWSKTARVLLVIPRRRPPRLDNLDMTLLKRCANQNGSQLGLVCIDPGLMLSAQETGVPVFPSVPYAQKSVWRTSSHAANHYERLLDAKQIQDLQQKALSVGSRRTPGWLRWLAFSTGLLAVLALVVFFVPSASIVVEPEASLQSLDIPVRASPAIPGVLTSGAIPAQVVEVTLDDEMSTAVSDSIRLPNRAAQGQVVLTNLTEDAVSVPAGTVFRTLTDSPQLFAAQEQVIVPAGVGQVAKVEIKASQPGSQGNVAANQIKGVDGSVGLAVNVDNPEATQGGSDLNSTAASEQDYARLYDSLITSLSEQAIVSLGSSLAEGETLLPATLKVDKIIRETRAPEVGIPTDQINLSMEVQFTALAYRKSDLQSLAEAGLNAALSAGSTARDASLAIQDSGEVQVKEDGSADWTIHASREVFPSVATSQVSGWIRGRTILAAQQTLSALIATRSAIKIQVHPDWWHWLPFLPIRIQVKVL